ncbi:MAG: porin [Opitutia bacterium]
MSNLKPLVLAAAAALTVTAHAGDKEVLDLLVKKGVITAEERAKAIQESKTKDNAGNLNEVYAKEDAVRRLTFSGRVQVQYENMGYSTTTSAGAKTEAPSTSDFILRRMYLGARADIGEGFSGEIVYNFADTSQSTVPSSTGSTSSGASTTSGAFDKAVFTAETSFGKFDVGYQKVQWGQEENTSSSKLPVVERSLVTRYWAESGNSRRVGIGARHTGVHYSNRAILGEGGQGTLNYGAAVVTSDQGYDASRANDLGLYGFASIEWKPIGMTVGLNLADNKNPSNNMADNPRSKGYNPYLRWVSGDVTVLAEYIDTNVGDMNPTGYNLTAVYKISDKLELAARYASLDTDGRGIRPGDGIRNVGVTGTGTTSSGAWTGGQFNEAESVYLGANYYFSGDNAKLQAGFEKVDLTQGTSSGLVGGKADADVFRVQVQILF